MIKDYEFVEGKTLRRLLPFTFALRTVADKNEMDTSALSSDELLLRRFCAPAF
jgi:hypothetical protein